MQELVKPVGATKKPQDSLLNNFTANCANLEPVVICSIIYYVLRDESVEWISKLRGMYCLETLLKHKRFFEYMKASKSELFALTFDEVAVASKSGLESISKLRSGMLERLAGGYEQGEKQGATFDISKLESLKEQGNKNFFAKMQNIKQGKTGPAESKQKTKQEPEFFEMEFTPDQPKAHGQVHVGQHAHDEDDFLGLKVAPQGNAPQKTHAHTAQVDNFDLLGNFSKNVAIKPNSTTVQQPAPKTTNDGLLDFNHFAPTQSSQKTSPVPGFDVNFDPKPQAPKLETPQTTGFSDMGLNLLLNEKDNKSSQPNQKGKDPFDFIVF